MALSRLLKPLYVGISAMSCVVEQKYQSTKVQTERGSRRPLHYSGRSARQQGPGLWKCSAIHAYANGQARERIGRQACDASGNFYRKFYYQSL